MHRYGLKLMEKQRFQYHLAQGLILKSISNILQTKMILSLLCKHVIFYQFRFMIDLMDYFKATT